jgi:hypothetical protein
MKKNMFFLKAADKAARLPTVLLAWGLLASALLTALLTLAGCPVEAEEGKTQKSAVQLTEDAWADGAVSSTSGEQWFKFTATAGTQYLHVVFGTMTAMHVQLYDSGNNALGDERSLSGSTKYLALTVTSGRSYYVKVSEGSSWAGSPTGTYRIGFNAMPLPCGTLAAATALTANTWANGAINTAGGEQWFKFTATAGTQYLHVIFGTLTDLYVHLYDGNGGTLGDSTNLHSSSTNKYKSLIVTTGQVYYVKVTPWYSNSSSGTYRIAFNTSTTAPASD